MPIYKSISAAKAFRVYDKQPRPSIVVRKAVVMKPQVIQRRQNKAALEIHKQQRMTGTVIPRHPFVQLVKAITKKLNPDVRFQEIALECLQQAAESLLIRLLSDCVLLAEHAKRVTIMDRDMRLLVVILRPKWAFL